MAEGGQRAADSDQSVAPVGSGHNYVAWSAESSFTYRSRIKSISGATSYMGYKQTGNMGDSLRCLERNPHAGGRRKQSEEGVPGVMVHTARALLGRLSRHLPSTPFWSLAFGSSEDLVEGLALFFRGRLCAELRFAWRGRRCPERHTLEFHHDDPYGFGGDRSAKNVRLLCRAHNRYIAEKDYGKEKMDQSRRRADRVRERAPSFSLFPDGVQKMRPFVLRSDLRRAPRRDGN